MFALTQTCVCVRVRVRVRVCVCVMWFINYFNSRDHCCSFNIIQNEQFSQLTMTLCVSCHQLHCVNNL